MIDASNVNFDNNKNALKAISLIKSTNYSVFLTGKAGTGKSTLLNYIIDNINKSVVKLAPTGVAAIHIGGQTIHRFFGFKVRPFLPRDRGLRYLKEVAEICKNVDTFIIDEVSMVRADLMTAIDLSLKRYMKSDKAFGGKQMLFVGDLFQLPPIVNSKNLEEKEIIDLNYDTPFFFGSPVFEEFDLKVIELNQVYRQSNLAFVSILDKIRTGKADACDLEIINQKYNPFSSKRHHLDKKMSLTSRTKQAENINSSILKSIDSPHFNFFATVSGTFKEENAKTRLPTHSILNLCIGARIMMINNDRANQWVNGSLGTITYINVKDTFINVMLDTNDEIKVFPYQWDDLQYYWNAKENKVDTKSVGTFTQLPVKLAWASTIHKSQGLTLEKVDIDLGHRAFAEGQTYVALSRCKSIDGIELRRKINLSDIKVSKDAIQFMSRYTV